MRLVPPEGRGTVSSGCPMSENHPFIERRREPRIPARGAVLLQTDGRAIHGRLLALSAVAVEITCELGFPLLGMAGERVALAIQLEGEPEPWQFSGRVTFIRASTHSLVVAYDDPSPELARRLASWLAESQRGVIEAQVLLWTRRHDDDRTHRAREDWPLAPWST
jgi:hypothetical protein